MSENVSGITRRVVENVSPKLLQKAADELNHAVEGQQPEATEPLAQVPGATLRAMIPINQAHSAPDDAPEAEPEVQTGAPEELQTQETSPLSNIILAPEELQPQHEINEFVHKCYQHYSIQKTIENLRHLSEQTMCIDKDTLIQIRKRIKLLLKEQPGIPKPTVDLDSNSCKKLIYFVYKLMNCKTSEEKKYFFEKNQQMITSLGFSSLGSFYAAMHGKEDPK